MNREALLAQWREEAARGMTGWDFSHLEGRVVTEPLPWDYREKVRDFLKPGVRLLDLGTGGGELLLELGHPFSLTSVTEGWEPNYQLCLSRLAPLGVTVKKYDSEEGLPPPSLKDFRSYTNAWHNVLRHRLCTSSIVFVAWIFLPGHH